MCCTLYIPLTVIEIIITYVRPEIHSSGVDKSVKLQNPTN